jgi:hypothetical protein
MLACAQHSAFLYKVELLTPMLLKQDYGAPMMKSSNEHHRELVDRCEKLISQMAVTFYVDSHCTGHKP